MPTVTWAVPSAEHQAPRHDGALAPPWVSVTRRPPTTPPPAGARGAARGGLERRRPAGGKRCTSTQSTVQHRRLARFDLVDPDHHQEHQERPVADRRELVCPTVSIGRRPAHGVGAARAVSHRVIAALAAQLQLVWAVAGGLHGSGFVRRPDSRGAGRASSRARRPGSGWTNRDRADKHQPGVGARLDWQWL